MNRNLAVGVVVLLATGCTGSPGPRHDTTTTAAPAPPTPAPDTTSLMALPDSAPLPEVEIRWQSGGGDGCASPSGCANYRITVLGDGRVTLEDLGWGEIPPKAAPRHRSIPVDDAVALMNGLFSAGFIWTPAGAEGTRVAVRNGNVMFFNRRSGNSGPWVDLTLRVGRIAKTVRVDENARQDLRTLKDRIWTIGGPKAWPAG